MPVRARPSETEHVSRRWGWRWSDKDGGEGESTTRGEVDDSPPWLPLPFHQPVERVLSHVTDGTFVARHARTLLRLESLDAGAAQRRSLEPSTPRGGGNRAVGGGRSGDGGGREKRKPVGVNAENGASTRTGARWSQDAQNVRVGRKGRVPLSLTLSHSIFSLFLRFSRSARLSRSLLAERQRKRGRWRGESRLTTR